jgi:hypothetical protein
VVNHKGREIEGHDADANWPVLNNVSSVSVSSGAVLEALGEVTIPNLRVDASGAGTIRNFAFAPGGTFDVVNLPQDETIVRLPGTYENCVGFDNLSDWNLTVEGHMVSRYRLKVADGSLWILRRGTVVSFR